MSCVTDVLKVDDIVNARVVEVDRERKRITVSMRSADAAANEGDRLRTTRQYERGAKEDPIEDSGRTDTGLGREGSRVDEFRTNGNSGACRDHEPNSSSIHETFHPSITGSANPIVDVKRERRIARRAERRIQSQGQILGSTVHDLDEGQIQSKICDKVFTGKGGTDLKRERKLARRAERRAAVEAANASA